MENQASEANLSKVTKQYYNKHFIVRYFPNTSDTHTNELIGYDKLLALFDRRKTRNNILSQAMTSKEQKHRISLRNGTRLEFVHR